MFFFYRLSACPWTPNAPRGLGPQPRLQLTAATTNGLFVQTGDLRNEPGTAIAKPLRFQRGNPSALPFVETLHQASKLSMVGTVWMILSALTAWARARKRKRHRADGYQGTDGGSKERELIFGQPLSGTELELILIQCTRVRVLGHCGLDPDVDLP